jgi:hypothetical protein
MRDRFLRRLSVWLTTWVVAGASILLHATPAAASVSRPFSGPTISSGTITFVNSYTVTVTASVYGDLDGPGYISYGDWFGVNGRYRCTSVTHQNRRPARLVTYTDTLVCTIANIQQIEIIYISDYGNFGVDYFNNPYAP